ncbi:hypothetical protein EMWEY_00008570 [Eimeria maxima]|uniref:Uncharacterized protein n=1 Tax=Eimeria maxima TaxID=5804 RepID=U6MD32_EIMMA|nr:hypothetical protein EMWEY_00008570 [Eimeria maxima]CDJ60983.1 hypothetical protein EMWEY_00008570 [Eimeria maxima]
MALRLTYRCSQKNEKMGLTKVGVFKRALMVMGVMCNIVLDGYVGLRPSLHAFPALVGVSGELIGTEIDGSFRVVVLRRVYRRGPILRTTLGLGSPTVKSSVNVWVKKSQSSIGYRIGFCTR